MKFFKNNTKEKYKYLNKNCDQKIDTTKIYNKEQFRNICKNNLELLKNIIIPNIPLESFYETIFIEFRIFSHFEYLIRNTILKLPNWAHTVVCGNKNYDFLNDICIKISPNIKIIKLDIDNLDTSNYSKLLMNKNFWNNFNGEKLLLYQEDSFLFHNDIEKFLKYDFIGAPWPFYMDQNINQKEYGVGNGGFSLRSKSKLIECIDKIDWKKDLTIGFYVSKYMKKTNNFIIPEDVFFSKSLLEKNIGILATRNIGLQFSQESVKGNKPLGGHQWWRWNHINGIINFVYKTIYLQDHLFYLKSSHRGGWKSIIEYGLKKKIININNKNLNNVSIIDCCESYFVWNNNVISKEWYGITHFTHDVPSHLNKCHIDSFIHNPNFLQSLSYCKGIIVLSKYMKLYFEELYIFKNIPIFFIKHPIGNINNKFKINNFLSINTYNLVLVGQQLRKYTDFIKIQNTKIVNSKIWLSGIKDKKVRDYRLYNDLKSNNIVSNKDDFHNIIKNIENKYLNDFKEYDNIITTNILIIPLYNSSANNAILEIIETNIPAFVTRLPATEEYLGKDYPMFYKDVSEINTILSDRALFNNKYRDTHKYLINMDKSDLRFNKFYSDLLKIINNCF
uniref:DUF5672 domain-containing protein n=1 Tax=viral metagenome TaxID=1070528 RepID=A0A6C0M031_9ZZZZ